MTLTFLLLPLHYSTTSYNTGQHGQGEDKSISHPGDVATVQGLIGRSQDASKDILSLSALIPTDDRVKNSSVGGGGVSSGSSVSSGGSNSGVDGGGGRGVSSKDVCGKCTYLKSEQNLPEHVYLI